MKNRIILVLLFSSLLLSLYGQEAQSNNLKNTHFNSPIESVWWLPDGKSYITTNGDTLMFWDSETDTVKTSKKDYNGQIIATRISPDGVSLVTIYDDNTFVIQDLVNQKYFIQQKGTSDIPVLDAVFIDDYFTLLLPMDGQNLYSFFCLLHTNEALIDEKIQSDSYVYGLDVDKSSKHLLITFSDGSINLLDLKTKEILQQTKSHSIVSITSEFTPDGKYFLYQVDENTVRIQSLTSDEGFTISDLDKPINTSDFTPNGKSVAMGDKNGFVKVYNVEKGYVEDALKLEDGDVAFSCDFSPDGKSLLIGTKNGNVIRWEPRFTNSGTPGVVIAGPGVALPPNQIIVMEDDGREHPGTQRVVNDPNSDVVGIKVVEKQATDEETGDKITISPTNPLSKLFKKNINLNPHNIFVTAGLGTINSENFWGNIRLKTGYVNYRPFPFYWGGGLGVEMGLTSDKFHYHYKVGNVDLGAPIMWGFAPCAIGGFHYLFEKPNILVFAEVGLGANIRMLASSSVEYPFVGTPAASFFSELAIGAEWKFLRAEIDIQLDTNFVYSVGGTIGAVIKLPSKNHSTSSESGGNN